jgi:hypothetical protein
MQGDPVNVFTRKKPADTAPGLQSELAPSDFFLFGYIKRKFTKYGIPDRQSLKARSPTFR